MQRIRMLTPDDGAALVALLTRVSPDTSYARFHGVVRVLTTPPLSRLLDLEQGRHEAVIAETDGGILAVARYVRDTPTSAEAEVAIVVADAWQRAGIGRKLMQELMTAAWQAGIRRFRATMMPESAPVRQFVSSLAPTTRGCIVDGKVVVTIDLPDSCQATRQRADEAVDGACASTSDPRSTRSTDSPARCGNTTSISFCLMHSGT
jgi:GNAT superfamily N-acetyltransferase